MSDLRTKLIRLASEKPELRQHLLPLLKQATSLTLQKKLVKLLGKYLNPAYDREQHFPWAAKSLGTPKEVKELMDAGHLLPVGHWASPGWEIRSFMGFEKVGVTPKGWAWLKQIVDQQPADAAQRARTKQLQFFSNRFNDLKVIEHSGYRVLPALESQIVDGYAIPTSERYLITKDGQNLLRVDLKDTEVQATYKTLAGQYASSLNISWSSARDLLAALSEI